MWDVGIAKMLKERDKGDLIGPCAGKVVSVSPLKVSILNGQVILQANQLYIKENLTLSAGNEVLLVPSADEQIFFIVDKIKKVGG